MIISTDQLNEIQIKELEELLAVCKKTDGSTPNVYIHILTQARILPSSLLYYDKQQLIGFLSAYFFYDDAVEVGLLVQPSSRRQGIAKELIQTIKPLIEYQNLQKIIFSCPSHLNDQWLLTKGFSYLHSEFYMERDNKNPVLEYNKTLTFRTATMSDILTLCALDEVCFPNHHGNLIERFQHVLNAREHQVLVALKDNKPIGKAHLRWQDTDTTLSDIAILPAEQGKGYGTALIAHCINLALTEGKPFLNLDVETHNLKALELYTRLGFTIQNACDYWTINLDQLVVG
jgi:ribosomal protein S18 acetylase RimI-like enzyme